MDCKRISGAQIDALRELQILYKAEIGEDEPQAEEKHRLEEAVTDGRILFYGAWQEDQLIGCCSITPGFSTFDYLPGGVLEDFYIRPEYRHKGAARELVQYAYHEGGVSSLTVGCADCDVRCIKRLVSQLRWGICLRLKHELRLLSSYFQVISVFCDQAASADANNVDSCT